MKYTEIEVRISVRTREGYSGIDIIERTSKIMVAPEDNPVNALRALLDQERAIINAHLFQFPETALIEHKEAE